MKTGSGSLKKNVKKTPKYELWVCNVCLTANEKKNTKCSTCGLPEGTPSTHSND